MAFPEISGGIRSQKVFRAGTGNFVLSITRKMCVWMIIRSVESSRGDKTNPYKGRADNR